MTEANGPQIAYRKSGAAGSGSYEVLLEGVVIGTVGRFSMSAAQFGSSWLATTPDGRRTKLRSREAAAKWLVSQVRQ
jgi:hypothetical protein